MTKENNLVESNAVFNFLPLPVFSEINTQDIEPALDLMLESNRAHIQQLINTVKQPDWNNFAAPMEELSDALEKLWAPISHLNGVKNTDELRGVYSDCLSKLTKYTTKLGQNKDLYEAYSQIANSGSYLNLSVARKKVIDNALRDFKLSGIALKDTARERFGEIKIRLSELAVAFSDHVLDATQGWFKHVPDKEALAGIPDSTLASYQQSAKDKDLNGYVITLDIPSYLPLMQYAESEWLREELYTAYQTRASELGPNAGCWDNSELINEILALRHELSLLLGFDNYAQYSLATKMAESTEQVESFLNELADQSTLMAKQEFSELESFAKRNGVSQINAWDVPFYSEKLRLHKYNLSQEELRPYFPVNKVIDGLFSIASKLFSIEIEPVTEFDSWHKDVSFFQIKKNNGVIAKFYLDLFARKQKRGGAWMADCRCRRITAAGTMQTPVAFLTCNFTPPTKGLPSLLTHNEVTTLFHEFGHGLHHMLTKIDTAPVSGINGVAWDAVELPSQFLENWCWQKEAIPMISAHYQNGEPLPDELLEKMLAAKNFQSGMQMVRQLELSLFDFLLHKNYNTEQTEEAQAVLDRIRQKIAPYPVPETNRFQHGFQHIFAGGYAAGYYSYKWAEVLSADAFSRFEEDGIFNQQTGKDFLSHILEQGGSRDAMDLFVAFRGRKPSVEALLQHTGISGNEK